MICVLFSLRALDCRVKRKEKKEIVNKCVYYSSVLYTIPKAYLSLNIHWQVSERSVRLNRNELFINMYSVSLP